MEYEKEYDYIVRGSIIPFLATRQKTRDSNWLQRLSLWSELLNSFLRKWCHEGDVHAKVYLQFLNVFMFSRWTFQNNKAPGNDGLSAEFYKVVWPEIGNLLVESLNYSYIHGELSTSQKEAVISLTEKKDKDHISRKHRR